MLESRLNSIFDIAGSNENALTRSFGVILRKDKTLLNNFLSQAMGKPYSISKKLFDETSFHFEKSHKDGRTDIEIENQEIHVIIESKIGTNEVKLDQALKYSKELNQSTAKKKCFVFLTEMGNLEIDKKLKSKYPNIIFTKISWDSTLELLRKRKEISVNLVNEYENYLLEGRNMRIYDIDIWAVVVSQTKQMNNWDNHNFYIHNIKHSPVFIGKRERDQKLNKIVVRELRPVLKIHDPGSEKGKANQKCYVYDLGKKFILQHPIVRQFGQAGSISVSFDDLD